MGTRVTEREHTGRLIRANFAALVVALSCVACAASPTDPAGAPAAARARPVVMLCGSPNLARNPCAR